MNHKTEARPGRSIDLAVDAGGIHYFDPDSGQAIGRAADGEGTRGRREARSEQA